MKLEKTVVAPLAAPYPVGLVHLGGRPCVVASTEDHGGVLLAEPPYNGARQIAEGPGGSMGLIEDRENPGVLYAIMGCFPGYKFQTGALYRLGRSAGSWEASRIAGLPFAHRLDVIRRGRVRYLVAATIAADKTDPTDWSRAGSVYAAPLEGADTGELTLTPVLRDLHKNHGFLVAELDGKPSLLISGAEGLYATDLRSTDPGWHFARVLSDEVSEVAVVDLDGDGKAELCTIEPFHGSRLSVYRSSRRGWVRAWEGELSYGHGLIAARWEGKPCLVVSNRSGTRDLVMIRWSGDEDSVRTVIDTGVGAANMLVLNHDGTDRLFSTNQATGEIAMYTPA